MKIEKHKGKAVHVDKLFNGLGNEMDVYMSHGEVFLHGVPIYISNGAFRIR